MSSDNNNNNNNLIMTDEPQDPKLNFHIVHCSGEDESFPVAQLVRHTSSTRGWHSMKLCEYPQEIILRFNGEVRISMIKILAHETKIASRIDLSVCRADRDHQQARAYPPLQNAAFHRLGYLSFTSNEASSFESRELKTAQINTRAVYLKLSLRRCHPNISNVFNQVGIVALGVYGEVLNEFDTPQNDNDVIYGEHLAGSVRESLQMRHLNEQQQHHHHQNQMNHNRRISLTNNQNNNNNEDEIPLSNLANFQNNNNQQQQQQQVKSLPEDSRLDPLVASKIAELSIKKTKAVDVDNFDEAKRLKIVIDRLRDSAITLSDLEERKRRAVASEDYDVAKALKFHIDEARRQVDNEMDMSSQQNNYNNNNNNYHQQQQQNFDHNSPPNNNNNQNTAKFNNNNNTNNHSEQFQESPPTQNPNSFDDRPAGVGARNPQQTFDETPVGGGNQKSSAAMSDEYPAGGGVAVPKKPPPKKQPSSQQDQQQQQQQNVLSPKNDDDNNNNAQQEGPRGLNLQFAATEYDEKPAISSAAKRADQAVSETGGIVVTNTAAAVNTGPVETATTDWEKALRAMIQSELSSDVAEPDALPTPNLPGELASIVATFGRYATACLVSKKFQHREAVIRVLGSDTGVALLVAKAPGKQPLPLVSQLLTYLAQKNYGVDDGISQVFFAVCDALKAIITGGISAGNDVSASDVTQQVSALIPGLLLKAGDSNQRVREHASATIMLIAMSSIGPEKISAALMHDPQTDSKKPLNFRVQSARISLASVMVNKIGLSTKAKPTGLTAEGLTKQLCIPQLTHSNSEVREGAVHLIVLLYGLVQPQSKMDALLVDVKPAQKALIDEQLSALHEEAANGQQQNKNDNDDDNDGQKNNNNNNKNDELQSTSVAVSKPSPPSKTSQATESANNALTNAREAAKQKREELLDNKKVPPPAIPANSKKNPPPPPAAVAAPTTPRAKGATKTPVGGPALSPGKKNVPAATTTATAPAAKTSAKQKPDATPTKTPAKPPGKAPPAPAPAPKTKVAPTANTGKQPAAPSPAKTQQQQQQQHNGDDDDEDEEDDPHTCQFCSRHDERYDDTSLDRHYLRSCPMLCACPLCGQICEISSLQEHLTTECTKSSLVRNCPNCHEAIRASDLDAHIAEASCIKHNPTKYNVCPLCHAKTAPFEEGWKAHFAQKPGCPNNPRSYDGGNVEDDFKD